MKKRFRDWAIPGPAAKGGIECADGETLDAIAGHWRIFQLKKGHRFSTDDVICAWYASQWAPRVEHYCDLGSGIGSVALQVAWRRPGCTVTTAEAQEVSFLLQKKSVRYNGIEGRWTALHTDLRDIDTEQRFDLITGSPPYWASTDALFADAHQAHGARIEMRGTIFDYAATAARLLATGGVFACVFQASHDERVRQALVNAGLVLLRTKPIRFKEGVPAKTSGIQVYLAAAAKDLPANWTLPAIEEAPLTIRNEDGSVHAEYQTTKLSFGFPP